ncbi:bifunctional DNA primase/polymerase [Deinococcus cellulosilyticus]|uniref:DNA primase/polymerase bifunctional N-terminal domain-containing protein n=1 Tax=Deinococcus cellulosilyticus (strain DSM 18568 / NBRC 106333 / KACC 11606 / 5516J-15) TaxID=1223518 RepID=A0A511NA09_DEIC1|nr:bifunctional DNA primase/polymerase [Deinococcus cellulosilyticus]GEM49640.1 hypothetical protein DC3_52750 [Deinococcus cellulosilyticus NBRC 106333 = KACC 11606]
MNPMLEAATKYVQQGFSVIPTGVYGVYKKQPHYGALTASGHYREVLVNGQPKKRGNWSDFTSRRPTPAELQTWFVQCNARGLALVTGAFSRVIVLDFDGTDGQLLLEQLQLRPHVKTPSGGFHVYVQHPGWQVATLNSKTHQQLRDYPGLDIRADGGLAMLPPTRTEDGPYQLLRSLTPEPLEVLPRTLREVLGLLSAPSLQTQAPAAVTRSTTADRNVPVDVLFIWAHRRIMQGAGRNDSGFYLATQMRDAGYTLEETLEVADRWIASLPVVNTKNVVEPYTASHFQASVRSAFRKPARKAWGVR